MVALGSLLSILDGQGDRLDLELRGGMAVFVLELGQAQGDVRPAVDEAERLAGINGALPPGDPGRAILRLHASLPGLGEGRLVVELELALRLRHVAVVRGPVGVARLARVEVDELRNNNQSGYESISSSIAGQIKV